MPLELYIMPPSSPCRAVMMLISELAIDVAVKEIDLMKGEQHADAFTEINPQHCVPTLVDTDSGFRLWESRAIMTYLVNKTAPGHRLYPSDDLELRATVDRMLYFDNGTLAIAVRSVVAPLIFSELSDIDSAHESQMKSKLKVLEDILVDNCYVAGSSLTIADFSIFATVTFLDVLRYELDDYPNIVAWKARFRCAVPSSGDACELMEQMALWLDEKRETSSDN